MTSGAEARAVPSPAQAHQRAALRGEMPVDPDHRIGRGVDVAGRKAETGARDLRLPLGWRIPRPHTYDAKSYFDA